MRERRLASRGGVRAAGGIHGYDYVSREFERSLITAEDLALLEWSVLDEEDVRQ
jgi:hypothetical protein